MQQLGRYELLAELGRGAMGTVYRARDPRIDRVVAIKTISVQSGDASQPEYRQRFFREAQAAGKLAHPGIVSIYDIGEDEQTKNPYIVMEYIAGQTLESMMRNARGRLPLAITLELIKQVAEALDYAHSQGVVHRDVKPANIIVTESGRAKVADFGVAKLALTDYTMPGQVLGTPSYMSPEQLSGEPVTGRSDLFSLGVILYSMLAGERPFSADTVTALTFQVVYKEHTPVTRLNSSLGADFDYVIARALAKQPADRYQRGQEMAADLDDLAQGRAPRSLNNLSAAQTIHSTQAGAAAAARPAQQPALATIVAQPKMRGSTSMIAAQAAGAQPNPPPRKRRRNRMVRVAAFLFVMLLSAVAYRAYQSQRGTFGNSYLRLVCFHDFRAAEFTLWVDNRTVLVGKLNGGRRENTQPIRIPAGKHTIRVRVVSPEDGYDQMGKITGELRGGSERTVRVISYRGRVINVAWQ
jgi:eukaryotic-like serine/threonine-protein kinase